MELSVPQILPIKCEYTFLFLDFLIIGLRNSSANFKEGWFDIFSFEQHHPKFFYEPLNQDLFDIHHVLKF